LLACSQALIRWQGLRESEARAGAKASARRTGAVPGKAPFIRTPLVFSRLGGAISVFDSSPNFSGATSMATYIVFTRESTQDQTELDAYQATVGESFAGHPVKVLAAYGPQQVLEGPAPEGVVIVEFPDTRAARAWYDSPEYQAVVQHRFRGATYRAVLVEGV